MCILVKMVMLRPALYFLKSLPTFKALTVIADISCSQALYSCEASIISHVSNVLLKFLLSLFSLIICVDVFIVFDPQETVTIPTCH